MKVEPQVRLGSQVQTGTKRSLRTRSLLVAAWLILPPELARAELPAAQWGAALAQLPDKGRRAFGSNALFDGSKAPQVPLLLRLEKGNPPPPGARHIIDRLYVIDAEQKELSALSSQGRATLSPKRSIQLSRVNEQVKADRAASTFGLKGKGAVVGIVDTGADVHHPALRDENGKTRIKWMLLYGQHPRGSHKELEARYGCEGSDPCAVYSADEIDHLLDEGAKNELPKDRIGHGTHIASIAAGRDELYPGIAPEADLIVVGASDEGGGVYDSRILTGTQFVFDQANADGKPAVVNISLGSNFGSHRGDSALEEGLAGLAKGPGRALVVASGNSGALHEGILPEEWEDFGSHAEFAVTSAAELRVPVLQHASRDVTLSGGIYLWIASHPGDELDAAVVLPGDRLSEWIRPGESGAISSSSWDDDDSYDVIVLNGTANETNLDIPQENIVVGFVGSFSSQRKFEIALRGSGTARLWVSGTGAAAYGLSGLGPLLPRARSLGTIQIPGTHTDLISVGASFNRDTWTDVDGQLISFEETPSGLSAFSSRGPNQLGQLKPELVAPGDGVIAAMAQDADPRGGHARASQFKGEGICPTGQSCFVIDDQHAIASGTSMAAPMVSGAIALLFQREPALTMEEVKRYLMAGAAPLGESGRADGWGSGQLDIEGALLAQDADQQTPPSVEQAPLVDQTRSYLVWADSFLRPHPLAPLYGSLLLRDADGRPRAVSADALSIQVHGPGQAKLTDEGPGLFSVHVSAERGSAGQKLQILIELDGQVLHEQELQIDLDPVRADAGYALTGGTCALRTLPQRLTYPWGKLLVLPLIMVARLMRRRAHHPLRAHITPYR